MRRGPAVYWWLAVLIAVAAGLLINAIPISNTDFFWHLKTGQLIIENGTIPHEDPFSYTMQGERWVTHEWLFEAVTWIVYSIGSFNGLCILKLLMLVIAVAFPVALHFRSRVSPVWIFVCVLTAMMILTSRIDWRPLIITTLLFSVFLFVLENYISGKSNRLWILPILTIIWANWHSGVIFGLLLIAYYALAALLEPGKARKDQPRPSWRTPALVALICLGCSLINPNTVDALLYPLRLSAFYSEVFLKTNVIEELQPLTPGILPSFWFSLALMAVGILASRRHLKWRYIILAAVLAFASMYRGRLVELYAPVFIVFGPFFAQGIFDWIETRLGAAREKAAKSVIAIGVIAYSIFLLHAQVAGPPATGLLSDLQPVASADWVEEFDPPGYMYNRFSTGGYLTWRLWPERRIFWDGRLLVFRDLFRRLAEGETIEDIHHIDWAIDIVSATEASPYTPDRWALVAFDRRFSLYLSRDGVAAELIDDHEYFMLGPYLPEDALRNIRDYPQEMKTRLSEELERFVEENRTDFGGAFAAGAYMMLGDEGMDIAGQLLSDGLERNPDYVDYLHYSAWHSYLSGDPDRAERMARYILFWWPKAETTRYLLARIMAGRDRPDDSVRFLRRAISHGYQSPAAYLLLAEELHSLGRDDEATASLENYFRFVLPQDYETQEYSSAVTLGRELTGL